MNSKRGIGALLIFIGTALLFNSASGITGFVISEAVGGSFSFVLGLVLVIGGIWILNYSDLASLTESPEDTSHLDVSEAIKLLRRELVQEPPESYQEAVRMVQDTLVETLPHEGYRSNIERKQLDHLTKLIANQYKVDKDKISKLISSGIHTRKQKLGRRGR